MKAHLLSFRKGWQSENLARYILSKFSFVAHPATIADDVGSDFFCTLFQIRRVGRTDYLLPKNSFAVQVKSNTEVIDFSNKAQYLENLEIPFFVGVVNRNSLKLTMYSGDYVSAFFSLHGVPSQLRIELCEEVPGTGWYRTSDDEEYVLMFPKFTEIGAETGGEELEAKVDALSEVCSVMQDNIASKRNAEYTFKLYGEPGSAHMFAGVNSAQHFRENFLKRLGEVFYNLGWLYTHRREQFREEEYSVYRGLVHQLEELDYDLPPSLTGPFRTMQHALQDTNSDTE